MGLSALNHESTIEDTTDTHTVTACPVIDTCQSSMEATASIKHEDGSSSIKHDTLSSAAIAAVSIDPNALPTHLRDHLVSVHHGTSTNTVSAPSVMVEGELLPPLAPVTTTLQQTPRNPPQRVIVCGAGIIGLTTSYYLAQQGHEVLCVEKEASVGTQASFCNGAFLDPALYSSWADFGLLKRMKKTVKGKGTETSLDKASDGPKSPVAAAAGEAPPNTKTSSNRRWMGQGKPMRMEFSAFCDPFFWKWGVQFLMNAKSDKANVHSRTIRELGFYSMIKLRELQSLYPKGDLDMEETAKGTIEVVRSEEELNHVLESDRKRHLDELGMDLQSLTADKAAVVEPALHPGMFEPGAILSPFGTSGDVHLMCQALYRLCIRQGVMFRFNTEVKDILSDRSRVIALETTKGGLIEGDSFVLAVGNATATIARRARLSLSIYPVKGYVLSVPLHPTSTPLRYNIYAGGMALVSPLGRMLRISGGVDFANPQSKQTNEQCRFEWLLSQAKTLFPEDYFDTKEIKTHVCWRPVTPDDVPLIGRTTIENLYVNAGHGSKGWTLSFGSGALLADVISGKRTQLDMSQFNPHRFGWFG